MSKADKMFEELGYVESETSDKNDIVYEYRMRKAGLEIVFDKFNKEYCSLQNSRLVTITHEEHLAIHEKMKELGWIEGGIK